MPLKTLQIHTTLAQIENSTTTNGSVSPSTTLATSQQINSSITSGNPIFVEHDKATHMKVVDINGTHGLEVTYSGRGVVKGIDFSANGTVVILPRSDGGADLSGHADITTPSGENGTYNFQSIGHIGFADGLTRGDIGHILASGPISDNGTAFFHTNSSGKLSTINNLVVVFKEKIDIFGNSTIVGWESK